MLAPLIDSHCHLDMFPEESLPAVVQRAKEAGLIGMTTIGVRLSDAVTQKTLTMLSEPGMTIWCSVGTHPDAMNTDSVTKKDRIIGIARDCNAIGLGETGLDYYRDNNRFASKQKQSFMVHIAAARELDIPVIVHAREADTDVADILQEEYSRKPFRFLLHCFASGPELAKKALILGGYISFSGIVTFKNAEVLRSILRTIPIDRLLVETDSPFLAPVPVRGRMNEPANVAHIARFIAETIGMKEDEIRARTTQNFFQLFSKAQSSC